MQVFHGVVADLTGSAFNFTSPFYTIFHTLTNIPRPVPVNHIAVKKIKAKPDDEKKKDWGVAIHYDCIWSSLAFEQLMLFWIHTCKSWSQSRIQQHSMKQHVLLNAFALVVGQSNSHTCTWNWVFLVSCECLMSSQSDILMWVTPCKVCFSFALHNSSHAVNVCARTAGCNLTPDKDADMFLLSFRFAVTHIFRCWQLGLIGASTDPWFSSSVTTTRSKNRDYQSVQRTCQPPTLLKGRSVPCLQRHSNKEEVDGLWHVSAHLEPITGQSILIDPECLDPSVMNHRYPLCTSGMSR